MAESEINRDSEGSSIAVVAKVIDAYNVVINKGSLSGLKEGDRILIYEVTEDITDPISYRSLGPLELNKGTGKIVDIWENKAIVQSDMIKSIGSIIAVGANERELDLYPEKYLFPFKNPNRKDFAKRIE